VTYRSIGIGGDYSDINAALNDLVALGSLADDYYFIAISNINNITASVGANILPGNLSITIDLAGYTVTSSQTINFLFLDNTDYQVLVILKNGTMLFSAAVSYALNFRFLGAFTAFAPLFPHRLTLANLFISNHIIPTPPFSFSIIQIDSLRNGGYSAYSVIKIYNVKTYNKSTVYNMRLGTDQVGGAGFGTGPVYLRMENCSLYNFDNTVDCLLAYDLSWANYALFQNCAFKGQLTSASGGYPKIQFINCSTSGNYNDFNPLYATITDCRTDLADADFESVDPTQPQFLTLPKGRMLAMPLVSPDRGVKPLHSKFISNIQYAVPGTNLYNTGIEPTLTAYDLDGNPYGRYGYYPIGCYNAEVVV
jgi:hypothetical protein